MVRDEVGLKLCLGGSSWGSRGSCRGHHHLHGNHLLHTHPSYIPSLSAASLRKREGQRWLQAQHRGSLLPDAASEARAGLGGAGPPRVQPSSRSRSRPGLPALPWNSRRPRCRDTSLSENSPVLFLTTRTMGFPSQNFLRGYLRRGDTVSAVPHSSVLRTSLKEEGTGSRLNPRAVELTEPPLPSPPDRPRQGAQAKGRGDSETRVQDGSCFLPRRSHGCGHLWCRFTPHSFKWLKVKGKGEEGPGTGTGRARRGEAHSMEKLCYLLEKSLVSWKGRKHRISTSDPTHLRQPITQTRPFLRQLAAGGVKETQQ